MARMQFSLHKFSLHAGPSYRGEPMSDRRCWIQFSLRGFFVILTIGCIWLGWKVEKVRERQEAISAIEAMGGAVHYECETTLETFLDADERWLCPAFFGTKRVERSALGLIVGDDFVHEVDSVVLRYGKNQPIATQAQMEIRLREALPQLMRLPDLAQVLIEISPPRSSRWHFCEETVAEFKKALPRCEIRRVAPKGQIKNPGALVIIPTGNVSTAKMNAVK